MQMTGVDPPELLHFLRNNYPEVILHPPQRSIYQLIRDKGFLPTRRHRYCCQILKEQHAGGTVTLLGIRAEESEKRALRSVFASGYRHLDVDQFNMDQEKLLTCVNGKDKLILSPILH